jgi:hypothetical protein
MKLKHNTVPPSLVEQGFYYEKGNSKGWLRYVIDFNGHEHRARYADFTGLGQCDASYIGRWASRRLSPAEAESEFPKEVAEIKDRISASRASSTRFEEMIDNLVTAHPGLTRDQLVELVMEGIRSSR